MNAFLKAIAGRESISIIAEVKRRSPSYGAFPQHDAEKLVKIYEAASAAAISVVTEGPRFGGSMELLREVVAHTTVPVLRKDFLSDERELKETKRAGAQAVLLIAKGLTHERLRALATYAYSLQLMPVIEVHDEADLSKLEGLSNIIVGINNRDLATHTTNVNHALTLIDRIPKNLPIIGESAFLQPQELRLYRGHVDAVLIGTAFLTAENISQRVTDFVYAATN